MALQSDPFQEEASPQLDISPLVDCAFLLLIYFLVSTSLSKEEADLSLILPGIAATESRVVKIDQMMVQVDAAGVVLVNNEVTDSDLNNRALPNLTDRLVRYAAAAQVAGSEPQIIVTCAGEVPEQRFVDVLNACAKAKIKNVSLAQ
jgi:biopolymer transport protein ExbD